MFIYVLALILLTATSAYLYLNSTIFGKKPAGVRLEKIKKSGHYRNGKFHNLNPTPVMTPESNFFMILREYMTSKRKVPVDTIPSVKTDLLNLDPRLDALVWFGHSSYFMQLNGRKILVDPVLSGSASPVSFVTKAFKGTDPYSPDDIPDIDFLFITHDHWDHLDYRTLVEIKPKIKKIFCALGAGEHLEYWGFDKNLIHEEEWNEKIYDDGQFSIFTAPARHFSGRGLIRNQSQWTSFVLQTPSYKIFIGGDSGYDTHFTEIYKKFGTFDLAILENGQYNKNWKYIHMQPDETLQAAKDLHAKRLFPVHSSKFALGIHAWDEPLIRITELCKNENFPLLTPLIGECVNLEDTSRINIEWWKGLN